MHSFWRYIRLTFSLSFVILALASLLWFLLPAHRPMFAGLAFGTLISILNGLILMVKTVKTGDYALGQIKRRQGTGTLQRFLLAGFAGYVAVKYPAYFHWIGVVIGLSTVTALSLIIALIEHLTKRTPLERGER